MPEEELTSRYKAFCREAGRPEDRVFHAPSVREALEMAFALDNEGYPLIYIGGSTYLVSESLQGF